MVVRRYVVKDMPEAVLLIRKELGKEAVILSTRKIYIKKWMGFWRARRIEVMAASGSDIGVRKGVDESPKARTGMVHRLEEFHQSGVISEHGSTPKQKTGNSLINAREFATTLENRSPRQPASGQLADDIGTNHSEIENIKSRMAFSAGDLAKRVESVASRVDGKFQQTLLNDLMSLGFSYSYANSLILENTNRYSAAAVVTEQETQPLSLAKRQIALTVLQQLGPIQHPEPIHTNSRVVIFIGPTGVGKTTTIAKLAAMQVLSGKRKVGLLTTDTFRIAAVEQLKTYAGILDVPIGIIRSETQIVDVFEQQEDRDLILIDTTGRNYRDPTYIEDMARLFKQIPIDETYLVLPMTGKTNDLCELTKVFEKVQFDKFLFTKMDETSTLGSVVELLVKCQRPLSYITTGQSVPDDLEIASLSKIVNLAFGEETW